MIELGGNIVLSGFKEVDPATMIIVKKIVGNHVRTLSSHLQDKFKKISMTLKPVHKTENSQKYELHAHLEADKQFHAQYTDRNLLVGLDKIFKKMQAEIEHGRK